MDQQYNYSPRDFVTVSTRADTIESLAGQESEIRNVGPEPERATVTLHRSELELGRSWTRYKSMPNSADQSATDLRLRLELVS